MDKRTLDTVTLILPYYRNPMMLRRQMQEWTQYPRNLRLVVVDDGSPEPAIDVMRPFLPDSCSHPLDNLELYRILRDIPWNRGGARNLGEHVCRTDWLIQTDIDHVLPVESFAALLRAPLDRRLAYRFPRFRVGRADETRKKDALAPDATFGPIKPHVDSYLIHKSLWARVGGYNEAYSGHIGGGNEFLRRLARACVVQELPEGCALHVYTRDACPDANDIHLSRDPGPNRYKAGLRRVYLQFPWERQL